MKRDSIGRQHYADTFANMHREARVRYFRPGTIRNKKENEFYSRKEEKDMTKVGMRRIHHYQYLKWEWNVVKKCQPIRFNGPTWHKGSVYKRQKKAQTWQRSNIYGSLFFVCFVFALLRLSFRRYNWRSKYGKTFMKYTTYYATNIHPVLVSCTVSGKASCHMVSQWRRLKRLRVDSTKLLRATVVAAPTVPHPKHQWRSPRIDNSNVNK